MPQPIPNPPAGAGPGKVTPHIPGLQVNVGDVILGSQDGGHVVITAHQLPQNPYMPFASNGLVHYSFGPSRAGG